MSQASHVIDGTQDGATYTQELNAALAALLTQFSGSAAPAATGQPLAYQWWADTATGLLKMRNATNASWIAVAPLAGFFANSAVQNLKIAHAASGNTVTAVTITADALSVQGTFLQSVSL